MTTDQPDHLVPDDQPLDVDEYHRAIENDHAGREELLKSKQYPQPYTLGAGSVRGWEHDLVCNGGIVLEGEDGADRRGWEIREKGTDADAGVWIRSTCRVSNLELMV